MADSTEYEQESESSEAPKKNWRKELEERAAEAEKAKADLAQELALYKSGLNSLSDDQRDDVLTLAKAKGDTSPEALKAIAERLSFTKPAEAQVPVEQPEVDHSAEAAELANLAGTSENYTPRGASSADAVKKTLADFTGSQDEYNQLLYANADLIAPQ